MIEAIDVEPGPQRHVFSFAMPLSSCDCGRTGKQVVEHRNPARQFLFLRAPLPRLPPETEPLTL
jgi:hypothetical protein